MYQIDKNNFKPLFTPGFMLLQKNNYQDIVFAIIKDKDEDFSFIPDDMATCNIIYIKNNSFYCETENNIYLFNIDDEIKNIPKGNLKITVALLDDNDQIIHRKYKQIHWNNI